jgi:hypothetical protein
MPGELAALFRSLADTMGDAAGSMAGTISRFTETTADIEDANVARTLAADADADSAHAIAALRRDNGSLSGGWTGARYIEASSLKEEAAYTEIRASTTDVAQIAANTGISEDIIGQVKTHLFLTEHDVPIGANEIVYGYFTADRDTAKLWAKAEAGTMDSSEDKRFRSLMAHEYIEKHLMADGMPYRSAHPAAWANDREVNPYHFGAHEAAPRSADGKFTHWAKLRRTPPEAPVASDLSNIDDVLNAVRRGLKL